MMNPSDNPKEIAEKLYRFDKHATNRVATIQDITEETLQAYRELGYLVIDNVLNEEEVSKGIKDINDVIHGRIVGPNIQFGPGAKKSIEDPELAVRKLHKFIDHCPALHHICYHKGILSVLEKLFGESPRFCEDQAILKPPTKEAGIEKPWHQDMAYKNFCFTRMVAGVWIALDEANAENGCMHIIPRSHMNGPTPHYAVRDWQLCDTAVDVSKDEMVEIKPGGVLIFCGLLHHGTPPNMSAKKRRALQYHYAPETAVKMSPQEYKVVFTNEMTQAEC